MMSDLEELHLNARQWLEYWTGRVSVAQALAATEYDATPFDKPARSGLAGWVRTMNAALFELERMARVWAESGPYSAPAYPFAA